MNCSPRFHFPALLILTVACIALIAVDVPSAGAAGHSCAASHSTAKWKRGSVRVYAKHISRGGAGHKYIEDVYTACSTKYRHRIVLEPDLYSGFSEFVEFRTNGRYLYYTVQIEGPVDGSARIGRMLDMKTGNSTRSLPAPLIVGHTDVPCVGFDGGCNSSVASSAINAGPGFALATNTAGGNVDAPVTYHRITIYCPNRAITGWTATEIESGIGALGPKTLHTDGEKLKWKIFGVRGSADFC